MLVTAEAFVFQTSSDASIGTWPPTYAMQKLAKADDAPQVFEALVEQGTPSGRIYGLCGLRQLAPKTFEARAAQVAAEEVTIRIVDSCSSRSMLASEAVEMVRRYDVGRELLEFRP